MAVTIRLQRTGKPKDAHYRVVAINKTSPTKGRALEILGHYHPAETKAKNKIVLKMERVDHWMKNGAKPSETVGSLIRLAKRTEKAS
jgi:small subunit ribosomal protein S16